MNKKYNKNAKVEQLTNMFLSRGEENGPIVKDPYCFLSRSLRKVQRSYNGIPEYTAKRRLRSSHSEVHTSKCRIGQSETNKLGEIPDHLIKGFRAWTFLVHISFGQNVVTENCKILISCNKAYNNNFH